MEKFCFIHSADIHLGSILNIEGADETFDSISGQAVYKAFDRICRAAIEYKVRFILISGDLYDKEARSVYANKYFVASCEDLNKNGIDVIVIAGNHDPANDSYELFSLTSNLHILNDKAPETVEVKNEGHIVARVIGQSYTNKWEPRPIYSQFLLSDDGVFNIAMLHTQLQSEDKKYIPSTVNELKENTAINYWALGHIHQPNILNKNNPVIAYSGIPQGRDFGEEGSGGCWLVEVDGRQVSKMQYIETASVIYKTVEIDIGQEAIKDAESIDELVDYIEEHAQELVIHKEKVDGYVIRWDIKGRGDLHNALNYDEESRNVICQELRLRLKNLKPFIWSDRVDIHTSNPDIEKMLSEHSILNELLEQSLDICLGDDNAKSELIKSFGNGWTVKEDPEDKNELKFLLDDETYSSLVEDARILLLEKLAERSE